MALYRVGDTYKKRKNIQYFVFEDLKQFEFKMVQYGNGLINTNGGYLVFGVGNKDRVIGVNLSRSVEDGCRLAIDRDFRNCSPTVGPNLYRFSVIELTGINKCIVEIKVAAGPIGSLYQTKNEEVYVIKNNTKVGPLWPQELKALIIKKYKEELQASQAVLSPSTTCTEDESASKGRS